MLWGIILILAILIVVNVLCYQIHYFRKIANIKSSVHLYLNSILALNVSHLHDAANFFNLQKNSSQTLLNTTNKDPESMELIKNINNISRGASYHFRSVFDELKKSIAIFKDLDLHDLTNNELDILYRKEIIDIRDLLELELFQISNFKRLTICDSSSGPHALIIGNFQLLSKCLLNLVENALKYCDGDIKLELVSLGNAWQIKIKSSGKPLPEDVIARLTERAEKNNYEENSSLGHGLSSLIAIMQFHQATIDVLSAENGNIITLSFRKHSVVENNIKKDKILKATYRISMKSLLLVSCLICLVVAFMFQRHRTLSYVDSIVKLNSGIVNYAPAQSIISTMFDDILYDRTQLSEAVFMNYTKPQLIRNMLINYLNVRVALQQLQPQLYSWKSGTFLAANALAERRYSDSVRSYAEALVLFLQAKLYLNKELVLLDTIEHYQPEQLINLLAIYYKPIIPLQANQAKLLRKMTKLIVTPEPINKPQHQSSIDMMIDAKTKDLGLELDL